MYVRRRAVHNSNTRFVFGSADSHTYGDQAGVQCSVASQGGGNAVPVPVPVPVRFRPSAGETRRASLALAYVGVDDGRAASLSRARGPTEANAVGGGGGARAARQGVSACPCARSGTHLLVPRGAPACGCSAVQTTTRSAAAAAGSMDRSLVSATETPPPVPLRPSFPDRQSPPRARPRVR